MRRMKDKVCLVTGATSGIGKVTATELARKGATVFIVARDAARGDATVAEIRRDTKNDRVEVLRGDLSSQADIRRVAAAFLAKHDRLHLLVNNAGTMAPELRLTRDGVESTLATNHLAYFLLTDLLLGALRAAAPARIVSVASTVHIGADLDLGDLKYERRSFAPMKVYSASKLANVIWSAELSSRIEGSGVTANCLHPGVIASGLPASGPGWMRWGFKLITPFLLTPEKGAETSLYLATSAEVEKVTGKYFDKKKPVPTDPRADDPAIRRRLWEISEKLVAASATTAA
jgi:NAD(P)-dependent dehydrogenase (short-subunit alcohol dehydrogenase family)